MKPLITKTYFYDTLKKHLSTYNHLNCIYALFGFVINAQFYCLKIIYIFLLYCSSPRIGWSYFCENPSLYITTCLFIMENIQCASTVEAKIWFFSELSFKDTIYNAFWQIPMQTISVYEIQSIYCQFHRKVTYIVNSLYIYIFYTHARVHS